MLATRRWGKRSSPIGEYCSPASLIRFPIAASTSSRMSTYSALGDLDVLAPARSEVTGCRRLWHLTPPCCEVHLAIAARALQDRPWLAWPINRVRLK